MIVGVVVRLVGVVVRLMGVMSVVVRLGVMSVGWW